MPGLPVSSGLGRDKRNPRGMGRTQVESCASVRLDARSAIMRSATCAPGSAGSVLLRSPMLPLLLLVALAWMASGDQSAGFGELRCKCVKTVQGIRPKSIASVRVILSGPSCPREEVIATLKRGGEVCLNPKAPWVRILVQRLSSDIFDQ